MYRNRGQSVPVFQVTKPRRNIMADVSSTVNGVVAGIVSLIKGLIVFFVFANILYSTGFDPVGGVVDLVNTFLDGGLAGLLALLFLVSMA